MDTKLLDILACPLCKGPLKFDRNRSVLVCRADRLSYPIREEIPIVVEEEATQLASDDPLLREA